MREAPSAPRLLAARGPVGFLLLLFAIGVSATAVGLLRNPHPSDTRSSALLGLLAMGAVLGGVALRRSESDLPEPPPAPIDLAPARPGRSVLGACLLAASFGLVSFGCFRLFRDDHAWRLTLGLWLPAIGLLLAAGFLLGRIGADTAAPAIPGPSGENLGKGLEVAIFSATVLLGLLLRVIRLDTIPPGVFVDETNAALDALRILEDRNVSPFHTGWYGTPNGYMFYMAGLIRFFGPTVLSLKLASLLPAVLTVPAVYPLARLMFGPVAGLAAMFFVATSRWHLTMSRWGWNETAPPLFQILATYFLLRALKERRASFYVAGGLLTGLMQYVYLSSRLAAATLAVFAVYWILTAPGGSRAALRRSWAGLALFAAGSVVAFAPLATTYVKDPGSFFLRMKEVNVFNEVRASGSLRPLLLNLADHARMFHVQGDGNGRHNLPGEPQVDPVVGILFPIGLAFALLRLSDPRRGLLVLWFVIAMAGGFLSQHGDSPQSYRTLTAVPAIALLAADVLSRLARATAIRGRRLVPAAALLVTLPCAASGLWEARLYFGRQASSERVWGVFHLGETMVAADVVRSLRAGQEVALSEQLYWFSVVRFLAYGEGHAGDATQCTLDAPGFRLFRPEADVPYPDRGRDLVLFLDVANGRLLDHVRSFYPGVAVRNVADVHGRPLYLKLVISRKELAGLQGLVGTSPGEAGTRIVPRVEDRGDDLAPLTEWRGGLRVEANGIYEIQDEKGLEVSLEGRPLNGPQFLGAGLYALDIRRVDRETALSPLAWRGPEGPAVPIPDTAFFRKVPSYGLLAVYSDTDSGAEVLRQRVPSLMVWWPESQPANRFVARFSGALRIPETGTYRLRLESGDGARMFVDGTPLGAGPARPVESIDVSPELQAGDHPFSIEWTHDEGDAHLRLYWQPPGQPETPIPPAAFAPSH